MALFLLGCFTTYRPDTSQDNWLQGSDSVRDLLIAYLCLSIACILFMVCCIGSCAVGARCCPCLGLLVPLTFLSAIFLFIMGSLGDRVDDVIDRICAEEKDNIEAFFTRVVDQPMCSDMCPCDDNSFVTGGYGLKTEAELAAFGRAKFALDGDPEEILLSRGNLDDWLADKRSANAGYRSLTKKILQYGGGEVAISDPYQWLFRKPSTVKTFEQCYQNAVGNQAFEEFMLASGLPDVKQDWEYLDAEETWDFLREAEETYDCAGLCYVPMFYLTKDISAG